MLEAIRNRAQGWIAKVILGLLVLSFAIWGVESYITADGQEPPVGVVGDTEISKAEFVEALNNQKSEIESQMGGKADIDSPALREQVLDQLINIQLLVNAGNKAGMTVNKAQIDGMLTSVPAFQENGVFSQARLDAWLSNRSMSQQRLVNMLQQDILLRQLQFGYGEGAVVASASAEHLNRLLAEQRQVNEVIFDAAAFATGVTISDAAIEAEYKASSKDFEVPEQVRLQYLALSAEDIQKQITIAPEAVQQYYDANKSRYQEPEQRRASHILIKADAGMDAAAKAAAKAKAEQLFAELQKTPERFAELAKANSADPGSAARGGDLGMFTRDMMVKPFADATFTMKVGETRGPIETQFGYHLIRLDAVNPGAVLGFELVRDEIGTQLRQQEAQRRFAEVAERFSNLVYEQPDSLEPAAKAFGLTLQESGWASRKQAAPEFLANARLMDGVFTPEALEKKQNTEAVEVQPGLLVATRVIEHKPAGVRPLAEVATVIREKLRLQAAHAKAVETGKAALAKAQSGQALEGLSANMDVSRMQPLNVPKAAIQAVFKASAAKLPAYTGVETNEGFRVYRINAVKAVDVDPAQAKMMRRDLARIGGQEELRAYLEYLRAQTKITRNQAELEKRID